MMGLLKMGALSNAQSGSFFFAVKNGAYVTCTSMQYWAPYQLYNSYAECLRTQVYIAHSTREKDPS